VTPTVQYLVGDVMEQLRLLPAKSVQMCVTSPPYWRLRRYGNDAREIGQESTPEAYVARQVEIFMEVHRVMKDDGTLWLNLGDCYASSSTYNTGQSMHKKSGWKNAGEQPNVTVKSKRIPRGSGRWGGGNAPATAGLKPKDLVGIPWMVAFALRSAGWWLRSDIVWFKTACMPESVKDRPTRSHEFIFLMTKSETYFYDNEAMMEPAIYYVDGTGTKARKERQNMEHKSAPTEERNGMRPSGFKDSEKFNGKHASEKQRGHSRRHNGFNDRWDKMTKEEQCTGMRNKRDVWQVAPAQFKEAHFATFPEKLITPCILGGSRAGDTVLDPFGGSGTTGQVALQNGRNAILIDLYSKHEVMAHDRCNTTPGMGGILFAPIPFDRIEGHHPRARMDWETNHSPWKKIIFMKTITQPIPASVLPNHIGFLGITGSGKTSSAKSAIVEPALERGERVIIIDPAGVWWGLRTKTDGKGKGYQIYVFGGQHGDYPLRSHDGALLAEAFATSPDSAVFDVSEMMPHEQATFFTSFVNTMRAKNRGAVNFIIEESHIFMPQTGAKMGGWAPAMLHAGNNLVSLGRTRGFRIVLLSQRPAKLHKDSLTQIQTLVAMRVISPQDRAAIAEWMKGRGDTKKEEEIVSSLASLDAGEGWVWAPLANLLKRTQFAMPKTFDSSKAPDFEEKEGNAPVLVPVNMDTLKHRLGNAEADRKANDPKELKAELARLRQTIANTVPSVSNESIEIARKQGYEEGIQDAKKTYEPSLKSMKETLERIAKDAAQSSEGYIVIGSNPKFRGYGEIRNTPPDFHPLPKGVVVLPARQIGKTEAIRKVISDSEIPKLGKAERLILTALAQYPSGRTKNQVAILAGYSVGGGGFNNALGSCISWGWLVREFDNLRITSDGQHVLGTFEPLPQGRELFHYWLNHAKIGKAGREILMVLWNRNKEMTKEQIAQETQTGYEPTGGGFNNALGQLRTLGLITGTNPITISPELY
jgi:DNA modification methylase